MIRLIAKRCQEEGSDKNANKPIHNPYKLVGKTVMHKKGGRWSKKQTGRTVASAKSAMRLLHGIKKGK